MGRQWIFAVSIAVTMIAVASVSQAASAPWSALESGLEYRKVTVTPTNGEGSGTLHFFRINPQRWQLKLISARQFNRESATIKFLAQEGRARLAINGGFFAADYKPLGLRISEGRQQNSIRNVSWWGIFAMVLGKPQVFSMRDYVPATTPSFAIQAGPRLVVNGSIPTTLKEGVDQRSGIGFTTEGLIILAVTDKAWLSMTEFAQWMRSSEGGGCSNALNLDGGHSSQLYYAGRLFTTISIENASTIVDGIGVFLK